MTNTSALIQKYYDAFNKSNDAEMLACLTEDIAHEANQGATKVGKEAFQKFLNHMNECYKESIENLVIMPSADGKNAAAEFLVVGKYLKTDGSLPVARGQEYKIKAGAFFDIKDSKIARVSTYYNLPLWIELVK